MRLTRSSPGKGATRRDENERQTTSSASAGESLESLDARAALPAYSARAAALPPAAAAFLSRHVACVFTGTCRLAATVARSVVDAWTRRAPGVEKALRACAALGGEMTDALDRLGALEADAAGSRAHFAGSGSAEARAALEDVGAALERHKRIQEELWPSIASPTVKALYDALRPVSLGSHICGAGNGGHVLCVLAPGASPAAAAAAVAACVEAPEARVVRVQMMLGGGGGGSITEAIPPSPGAIKQNADEGRDGEGQDGDGAASRAAEAAEAAPPAKAPDRRAAAEGGAGGRGRGGRGGEATSGRGRKKRRTG